MSTKSSVETTGRGRCARRVSMLVITVCGFQAPISMFAADSRQASAVPTAASPPSIVFGAFAWQGERMEPVAVSDERTLSTRPVGLHVFKTIAEVDGESALNPGETVDVSLATLTDEGMVLHRILQRITIYSVAAWNGQRESLAQPSVSAWPSGTEPTDANIEVDASAIIPVRLVGLLVNSKQLETLRVGDAQGVLRLTKSHSEYSGSVAGKIWHNFTTNLFQPLLLFFFMGFSVPLLKVPLEFPKALYQSLSLYLLVAIGWHGGELMAQQSPRELAVAGGLAVVGLVVNGCIAVLATKLLQWTTRVRRIDAVTVGAYYGSDSAGTFVTCLGILASLGILHDSYMPVMLAVMEIPGCLVGLYLVSKLRGQRMDPTGNLPGEPGYQDVAGGEDVESAAGDADHLDRPSHRLFDWKVIHEVFFNPGLFLLFGGIVVGFISGLQAIDDPHVVEGPNHLFIFIFKGALCLFLLEMGITACERLQDLKSAGWGFTAFGLLAPNLFAVIGMLALHGYSWAIGHTFYLGTYALMAVLCGAASYIAMPAVQRLAIPEASPTLPLAASLGLTFTWNVTLGIPIYIEVAKVITG